MMAGTSNIPLPYAIEYAKSGRSTCKKCKKLIAETTLRMSVIEQSPFFDGNMDTWHHFECFWTKLNRDKDDINISSIRGVDWLRWEDQEELRAKIGRFKGSVKSPTPEGEEGGLPALVFSQLKTEKSQTSRGKCQGCGTNFEKGEIKMWRRKWLHAKCIFKESGKFVGELDKIPNWMEHEEAERVKVEEQMDSVILERSGVVKEEMKLEEVKKEESPEPESSSMEVMVVQDQLVLEEDPRKPTIGAVKREHVENDGEDAIAKKRRLEKEARLAEIRKAKTKKQVDHLWNLRQMFDKFTHNDKVAILAENQQDIPEGHDPTAQVMDRLVDNALFGCPIGCPVCPNGKIVYNSARRTYVCTGYATEYSRCTHETKNPVRTPFTMPSKIISKYRLKDVTFNGMRERLYMDEGEEVVVRNQRKSAGGTVTAMMFAAEAYDQNNHVPKDLSVVGGSNKHIIKNGTLVDAKFTYADRCHVFKNDNDGSLYQATLSLTDLTQNKNSFYKIQLLKDDRKNEFHLFRSWGRVGTEVGGHLHETFYSQWDAVNRFQEMFKEKTHNEWKFRKHFRKLPGLFNYVETDFSEFEQLPQDVLPGSKTLLPKPVKEIVMSIFDVENMKSAMKSFEMDINKMPLGRLSRNQINQAFSVLTELGDLLSEYPTPMPKVVDATNKFYTIIPHNFGMNIPEPIDSFHKVKAKNNMLNALLDIKFAYDQLYNGDNTSTIPLGMDPVDVNYEKLKCIMTPLDPKGQDYKDIADYMYNTHGSTHDVKVDLVDILELNRLGEDLKFKSNIGNRMLLWHGSGKMNFAGILGQGLRIAPPEAPASGYMFGKGVYFADMFTKSFFYCRAGYHDEAYLLLCDVALGSQMELNSATNITKSTLRGFHSVKGVGQECPDESGRIQHPAGYMIPKGVRKQQLTGQHGVNFFLLYNEYIVYDVDQIHLRYLVRVKMHHARHR